MDRKALLIPLAVTVLLLLVVHYLATVFYWYYSIWWFDMPMHFLGGFWLALAYCFLFLPQEKSLKSGLKIILGVILLGIAWEVYEAVVNTLFAQLPFDLGDSSSDVFFDLLGGLVSTFYIFKWIMPRTKNNV